MKTTLENTTESRSANQASAQVRSIVEMVRALTIETAAEDFVAEMNIGKVRDLVFKNDGNDDRDDEDSRERLTELLAKEWVTVEGFEFDEDEARQTMQEDPLSVQVRSGWHDVGAESEPEEFMILLCTGGPAVRIIGDLGRFNEPENIRVEHQDWGTPWTEISTDSDEDEALATYCREFLSF